MKTDKVEEEDDMTFTFVFVVVAGIVCFYIYSIFS